MEDEEIREETPAEPSEEPAAAEPEEGEAAPRPKRRRRFLTGALIGLPLGLGAAVAASRGVGGDADEPPPAGPPRNALDAVRRRLREAMRQGRQAAREAEQRKQDEYQERLRGG